jgi:hypothetical protein
MIAPMDAPRARSRSVFSHPATCERRGGEHRDEHRDPEEPCREGRESVRRGGGGGRESGQRILVSRRRRDDERASHADRCRRSLDLVDRIADDLELPHVEERGVECDPDPRDRGLTEAGRGAIECSGIGEDGERHRRCIPSSDGGRRIPHAREIEPDAVGGVEGLDDTDDPKVDVVTRGATDGEDIAHPEVECCGRGSRDDDVERDRGIRLAATDRRFARPREHALDGPDALGHLRVEHADTGREILARDSAGDLRAEDADPSRG